MEWIELALISVQWRGLVCVVIYILISKKDMDFLDQHNDYQLVKKYGVAWIHLYSYVIFVIYILKCFVLLMLLYSCSTGKS